MSEQTVLQAKRLGVYTCTVSTTLGEAAKTMVGEDISVLVVVDESGFLCGIISRTDLLRGLINFADWRNHSVRELMAADVVTVTANTQLTDVANLLLDKHIHRVVVVRDEDGKSKPIAVVSDADLVYHMAH